MFADLQYRNELMEMEVEHYLELLLPHARTHTNTHERASYTHFHNHWATLGKLLMDDSFFCLFIFNVPPSVKTL